VALETVSSQRLALATEVESEIRKQSIIPVGGVNLVLEIPIVGFGNQSRFLGQTGAELEKLEMDGDELILLLVNRPFNKSSDKTGEEIRE
jgi:hypothetical protein